MQVSPTAWTRYDLTSMKGMRRGLAGRPIVLSCDSLQEVRLESLRKHSVLCARVVYASLLVTLNSNYLFVRHCPNLPKLSD